MRKNRVTAAALALFLGLIGAHKFYLRKPGQGIMYLFIFFMTTRFFPVSFILGVVDAVKLLMMSDEQFDEEYNKDVQEWQSSRRQNNRNQRRQVRDRHRTAKRPSRTKSAPARPRFEREHRRTKKKSYPKTNPYKQSGIRRFKDYDIEGAIEDFEKALKSSPGDASLHFNLACSYSLNENADKAFSHLDKAVKNGFNDFEKIGSHQALAFLRIQEGYDAFKANKYQLSSSNRASQSTSPKESGNLLDEDVLLKQLNKLGELREKGLLTEAEFMEQKRRLMD